MVKSGLARSRSCDQHRSNHPYTYTCSGLPSGPEWRAAWITKRDCGSAAVPAHSRRFCLSWTIQADYGLVSKSAFDVRMGIMQRTPNRDLRRAASPSDVRGAQHAFYGSTADFSETALAAFADAFLAGELIAHVKPDPRDEL